MLARYGLNVADLQNVVHSGWNLAASLDDPIPYLVFEFPQSAPRSTPKKSSTTDYKLGHGPDKTSGIHVVVIGNAAHDILHPNYIRAIHTHGVRCSKWYYTAGQRIDSCGSAT